jgi:hypothetical protein
MLWRENIFIECLGSESSDFVMTLTIKDESHQAEPTSHCNILIRGLVKYLAIY